MCCRDFTGQVGLYIRDQQARRLGNFRNLGVQRGHATLNNDRYDDEEKKQRQDEDEGQRRAQSGLVPEYHKVERVDVGR